MKRWIVLCGLSATLPYLSGCALFSSDPVPPAPSLTGIQAQHNNWQNKIYSSPTSDLPAFEPLLHAQRAVKAAQSQPNVNEYDSQSLTQARQALQQAEDDWGSIAGKKDRDNAALAKVAGEAHQAQRLAEIAQYTAQREVGLVNLRQLEAQHQQQMRIAQQKKQQQQQRQQRQIAAQQAASRGNSLVGRRVVPEMLGSLSFEQGTARLTQSSHSVITRLAKLAQAHPKLGVALFGFTSNSAPPDDRLDAFIKANPKLKDKDLSHAQKIQAYQQGLSLARARDVAELLVQAGLSPDRIGIQPMGASHPIASNKTAQGRKKNARVEAIMVPPQGKGGH